MVTEPAASTDMLADALVARVRAAEDTYYRLVVLAGPPRSGKVRRYAEWRNELASTSEPES